LSAEAVEEGWREGVAAWPSVRIPLAEFARHLEASLSAGETTGPVSRLCWKDAYLACGCVLGDREALACFESAFGRDIDTAARRILQGSAGEDAAQLVRHRLIIGQPDAPPKIASYTGRGELRGWARIAATRIALNVAIRAAREQPFEADALTFLVGTGDDPEVSYFKRVYTAEFRLAFQEAFAALAERERTLIRYAFANALTVDQIGAIYNVHRATAARWVTRAQSSLVAALRAALVRRLGVNKKELESILQLIQSRFEITLERYLRTDLAG
jgi:RNA polymerase sigma-70 factor (ECF subfamily)